MADLVPSKNHNVCANLDETQKGAKKFRYVIRFLQRSEIYYAISTHVDVYEDQIQEFWRTAEYKVSDGRLRLEAKVQKRKVVITEATIRNTLKLNDDDQYNMTTQEMWSILRRMGYETDPNSGKILKSLVGYNWRYIWHVVIHVFAARNTGWDNVTKELAVAITCLCTMKPFNWAGMIFDAMRKNANNTLKNKLLLYPRFIQMILNEKFPDLACTGQHLRMAHMNNRIWKDMRQNHPRSRFSGRFTDLFPNMKIVRPDDGPSSEEDDSESDDDVPKDFDPRTKKFVSKQSVQKKVEKKAPEKPTTGSKRRLIDERSESETESEDAPIAKSIPTKGKTTRIVIKKSTVTQSVEEGERRSSRLIKRAEVPKKTPPTKKQRVVSPSRPSSPSGHAETQSEYANILRMMKQMVDDMSAFKKQVLKEIELIPDRVRDMLIAEGWERKKKDADDDVIII